MLDDRMDYIEFVMCRRYYVLIEVLFVIRFDINFGMLVGDMIKCMLVFLFVSDIDLLMFDCS